MTITAGEAPRVVELFTNDGFDAWRQLKLRYILTGGWTEVDRTVRLVWLQACRNMTELPAAIDLLDKELMHKEETGGHRRPDHTKIVLLVQLFFEADQKELPHRYIRNQKSFEKARADVLAVAVEERVMGTVPSAATARCASTRAS